VTEYGKNNTNRLKCVFGNIWKHKKRIFDSNFVAPFTIIALSNKFPKYFQSQKFTFLKSFSKFSKMDIFKMSKNENRKYFWGKKCKKV